MTTQPTFTPSDSFVRQYGDRISPDVAVDLMAGVVVNHDSHPDIVTLAAELAISGRRPIRFVEIPPIAAEIVDLSFDEEGWLR